MKIKTEKRGKNITHLMLVLPLDAPVNSQDQIGSGETFPRHLSASISLYLHDFKGHLNKLRK